MNITILVPIFIVVAVGCGNKHDGPRWWDTGTPEEHDADADADSDADADTDADQHRGSPDRRRR